MTAITSSVATTMVNAAFLQEVKDSNLPYWQAIHDFKRLLAAAEDVQDQSPKLVKLLSDLRDAMALEFSLEETYGYIDGTFASTSLSAMKASLAKWQHRELYLQLHEISESADEAQYRGTICQDFPRLATVCKEFLASLESHEKHESELIGYELGMGRFGS